MQGVLYCATNRVGRFHFNRVAQEEEEVEEEEGREEWRGEGEEGWYKVLAKALPSSRGNCPKKS